MEFVRTMCSTVERVRALCFFKMWRFFKKSYKKSLVFKTPGFDVKPIVFSQTLRFHKFLAPVVVLEYGGVFSCAKPLDAPWRIESPRRQKPSQPLARPAANVMGISGRKVGCPAKPGLENRKQKSPSFEVLCLGLHDPYTFNHLSMKCSTL